VVQADSEQDNQPSTVEDGKRKKKPRVKTEIVKHFTVKDLLAPPSKSLSISEMADYVRAQIAAMGGHYKQIAMHTLNLGIALNIANESFAHGEWGNHLKEIGLSGATAWRARELARLVKSPEDLASMTKTQAYRAYGILPPPKHLMVEKLEGKKDGPKEEGNGETAGEETKVESTQDKVEQPEPSDDEIGDDEIGDDEIGDDEIGDDDGKESDVIEVEVVVPEAEDQSDKHPQPELKVAYEDVTEDEMNAFTAFVEAAGSLERAKAIFKTCLKTYSDLYAD
jgi:hypothetical protein